MSDYSLTSILFSWINFAVLIGLGIYGFMRYLLPSLNAGVKNEEMDKANAHEHYKTLMQQKSNALRTLQHQKQLIAYLQEQINSWHNQVTLSENALREKKLLDLKKLKEKRLVQEINRSEQIRLEKALDGVFAQAESELKATYTQQAAQKAYLSGVLQALRPRE